MFYLSGGGRGFGIAAVEPRFRGLHIPVRKLVPKEVVDRAPGRPKVQALLGVRDIVHRLETGLTARLGFSKVLGSNVG